MSETPVRTILKPQSPLRALVQDGLGALDRAHKDFIHNTIRKRFLDSLDIDTNLRAGNEGANRWDYLLGDGDHELVVALEPHGARDSEISVVVAKRSAARQQLQQHLVEGTVISAWFWVRSSGGGFKDTDRARRIANNNGVIFVGPQLMEKHLTPLAPKKKSKKG